MLFIPILMMMLWVTAIFGRRRATRDRTPAVNWGLLSYIDIFHMHNEYIYSYKVQCIQNIKTMKIDLLTQLYDE